MKVLCAFCTNKKDKSTKLLPASARYLGSSAKKAAEKAKELNLPLYFMSGEFGFIPETMEIPDYDKLLVEGEVATLSDVVAVQMAKAGVSSVLLYAKPKEKFLIPYYDTIETACAKAEITLELEIIE